MKHVRVCSKYRAPMSLESITARLLELESEKRALIEDMKQQLLSQAKQEKKIEVIKQTRGEFVFNLKI
jgi:hypothetical protein